jgi:hypothetical protein
VKTTFLNGELEEIKLDQPRRFIVHGKEVCKLKRPLYSLNGLQDSGIKC